MTKPTRPDPSGLLLIDKPGGKTSHDVVARVRRQLGTRRVGHAGTLDPMATGLLVILVGDATRVASYVTAEDKRYDARITFGRATDSLDADGVETETALVPETVRQALREAANGQIGPLLGAALDAERTRREQVPPAVSALHVDGVRAHERVRRGETVTLPPRPVSLLDLVVNGADGDSPFPSIDLSVHVSKGYYVRSLARDLGAALGLPAHLSRLRRTSSGALDLGAACLLDADLGAALVPMLDAMRTLFPWTILTTEGALRARLGKVLSAEDFQAPPGAGVHVWLDEGAVVALGDYAEGVGRVCRGFPSPP